VTKSQLSYFYTKSWVKAKLIHMVERGHDVHQRMLSRVISVQQLPSSSTWALPDDAWLAISSHEAFEPAEFFEPHAAQSAGRIISPVTGTAIDERSATRVICRHITELRRKNLNSEKIFLEPSISFQSSQQPHNQTVWRCTMRFPDNFSSGFISGDLSPSKAHARRSVCLKACQELYYRGALDYRFFPRHTKQTRLVPSKVATKGTTGYVRQQPILWTLPSSDVPGKTLFWTTVTVNHLGAAPYALLTRLPLPHFEDFDLFREGVPVHVRLDAGDAVSADSRQIELLRRYTIRACRAVMNKRYACKLEEMPYLLAPIIAPGQINWDAVESAAKSWGRPIKLEQLQANMVDAVVLDKAIEFTRKFYVTEVREDLSPLSKPEEGLVSSQHITRLIYRTRFYRENLAFHRLQNIAEHVANVSTFSRIFLNHFFKWKLFLLL
jgi:endoribonuclease Dicer